LEDGTRENQSSAQETRIPA